MRVKSKGLANTTLQPTSGASQFRLLALADSRAASRLSVESFCGHLRAEGQFDAEGDDCPCSIAGVANKDGRVVCVGDQL